MVSGKLDKIDENKVVLDGKKAQAVELWRETRGHISNICRALGIHRSTYYLWISEDPIFAQAIVDAESELNDDMREALVQKGADGDLGAITFYLKNRHPEFKPQPAVQVNTQVNNFGETTVEKKNKYGIE